MLKDLNVDDYPPKLQFPLPELSTKKAPPSASPVMSSSGGSDACILKGTLEALLRITRKWLEEMHLRSRRGNGPQVLGGFERRCSEAVRPKTLGMVAMLESIPKDDFTEALERFVGKKEVASERITGAAVLAGYASSVETGALSGE